MQSVDRWLVRTGLAIGLWLGLTNVAVADIPVSYTSDSSAPVQIESIRILSLEGAHIGSWSVAVLTIRSTVDAPQATFSLLNPDGRWMTSGPLGKGDAAGLGASMGGHSDGH